MVAPEGYINYNTSGLAVQCHFVIFSTNSGEFIEKMVLLLC